MRGKHDGVGEQKDVAALGTRVQRIVPSLTTGNVAEAIAWYVTLGFTEAGRHEDDGEVNWGMVSFGTTALMLSAGTTPNETDAKIWIYVDDVRPFYSLYTHRESSMPPLEFIEDLYEPFYGGRQFSLRDPGGYALVFYSTDDG